MTGFAERYGNWAVVAGASEGLGAAFASTLAERGLHLVLLARREALLAEVADRLRKAHAVQVRCLAWDLADPGFAPGLRRRRQISNSACWSTTRRSSRSVASWTSTKTHSNGRWT